MKNGSISFSSSFLCAKKIFLLRRILNCLTFNLSPNYRQIQMQAVQSFSIGFTIGHRFLSLFSSRFSMFWQHSLVL